MECKQFISVSGKIYPIQTITAAYNEQTKETRIYAEFERTREKIIDENMQRMGAVSISIKTFSPENWERESFEALQSVISFADENKLVLMKTAMEPRALSYVPAKSSGIYVLYLDTRTNPFFYVGKANDIERRIQQHETGSGAYCITGEPFTRVEPVTKGSMDDIESWERNEVLTRMYEFGIDNVRGWMYTFKTMSAEQKLSAFDQICEKFDRCRKCGRGTHFVRDCHALSTDLWTCGMEIRMPGGGSVVMGQDDADRRVAEAEHKINEAKRMVAEAQQKFAEAARVLGGL